MFMVLPVCPLGGCWLTPEPGCWAMSPTSGSQGGLFLPETQAQCRLALQQTASTVLLLLYKIPSESREMGFLNHF